MIFDWDDYHENNHRLDLLHRLKEANPAFRCTLFAVPGCGTSSFWESTPEWCELAVHGWLHPHPREAQHWTYEQTIWVMANAHPRFVTGFKAPGWQISNETYRALHEWGWWVADHPESAPRRPEGIVYHQLGDGEHWHGHIQDDCGNGLEETWDTVFERVALAESFELISEVALPWRAAVAA